MSSTDDHPQRATGPEAPVDPDIDLSVPAQRREFASPRRVAVLAAIGAGGVAGAEARYGLGVALPHSPEQWPWSILIINVTGCLLIGVLMVTLLELTRPHPLVRPLLGVGVLGGYTTFSTYTVDTLTLFGHGQPALAFGYLVLTPLLAIAAVTIGAAATRAGATLAARRSPVPKRSGLRQPRERSDQGGRS
ncbi:fluoride efflux transporter FluC [Pseudonocardia sp. GCM10023141]|uniref:fluoride efflux transporter FluC n=1 Tax=Pseudonocardia sp. GCM10023141 TaxID=3252653 RepID=UPI00361B9381